MINWIMLILAQMHTLPLAWNKVWSSIYEIASGYWEIFKEHKDGKILGTEWQLHSTQVQQIH